MPGQVPKIYEKAARAYISGFLVPFQGILEGEFRGCSRLLRGDAGRLMFFFSGKVKEIVRSTEENYTLNV